MYDLPSLSDPMRTSHLEQWNELYKAQLYGLWYTTLSIRDRKWTLSETYHNILQDTKLELTGLYDTAEATDNFALCPTGIAFIARDAASRDFIARLDTFPFFSPLSSFQQEPPGKPVRVTLPAGVGPGESICMRIAPDESTVGFLHAPATDLYNRRLYVAEIGQYTAIDAFVSIPEAQDEKTYEPPACFEFAGNSTQLILQRDNRGRSILLHLDLEARSDPRPLTTTGTVKAYYPLRHGNWEVLLVTSTSFIDSSLIQTISTTPSSSIMSTISSATEDGAKFGLSREMILDVGFRGADDIDMQAFIVRPSDFDANKTYPWVLMPHGGPVTAWTDSWSTRVSPEVIARNRHLRLT